MHEQTSLRMLPYEALILLAGLAVMLTAGMLELQTSATAYIIGESHWSKSQQSLAHELQRYAASGDPAQLQRARDLLRVPLGDRRARLALEQDPVDLETPRQGFLDGMNAPEGIGRMIRMYRYLHNAPFFRESVAIWRKGDEGARTGGSRQADGGTARARSGEPHAGSGFPAKGA